MFEIDRNFAILTGSFGSRLVSSPSDDERRKYAIAANVVNQIELKGFNTPSGGGNSNYGAGVVSSNAMRTFLEGLIDESFAHKLRLFKDIYYHDAICGSAVDIYSSLPFSSFNLTGIKDRSILDTYHESVEYIHPTSLLPAMSRDYLTFGAFLGSGNFDKQKKIYNAIMPQRLENAIVTEVPIFGIDPLIDIEISKELLSLINKKDNRMNYIMDQLPPNMLETIKSTGKMPLDPLNTFYVARRTLTSDVLGTSLYERILPVHLIEKALFRGTIDAAQRRQRAILWGSMGDVDEWVPTENDLNSLRDAIIKANSDPTGAVLVTRTGINIQEFGQANDFWKSEDIFEYSSNLKYRAFGISESIIIGDASLSTLDASLSIMVDNFRNHRNNIQHEFFHRKFFPNIAAANDFVNSNFELHSRDSDDPNDGYKLYAHGNSSMLVEPVDKKEMPFAVVGGTRMKPIEINGKLIPANHFIMPKIVWHKHLNPEGDQAYIDMLKGMQEIGLPIPLATFAAAAGLDVNAIMNASTEDLTLRKQIKTYQDKIQQYLPKQASDNEVSAAMNILAREASPNLDLKQRQRQFDDERYHPMSRKKNGRVTLTSRKEKVRLKENLTTKMATVLANRADRLNRKMKNDEKENRKPMVHGRFGKI